MNFKVLFSFRCNNLLFFQECVKSESIKNLEFNVINSSQFSWTLNIIFVIQGYYYQVVVMCLYYVI